jgi:hypothetical protein
VAEAPSERLSADELCYHEKVVAGVHEARQRLTLAEAVGSAWFAHLMERYGLRETDVVEVDGTISRLERGLHVTAVDGTSSTVCMCAPLGATRQTVEDRQTPLQHPAETADE